MIHQQGLGLRLSLLLLKIIWDIFCSRALLTLRYFFFGSSPLLLPTRFLIFPDYVPIGHLFQPNNGDRRCTDNAVKLTVRSAQLRILEAYHFSTRTGWAMVAFTFSVIQYILIKHAATVHDMQHPLSRFCRLVYATHIAFQLLG